MYDMGEISIILVLVILHINYMFVLNYGGEEIQGHGIDFFNAAWVFCDNFVVVYIQGIMLKHIICTNKFMRDWFKMFIYI